MLALEEFGFVPAADPLLLDDPAFKSNLVAILQRTRRAFSRRYATKQVLETLGTSLPLLLRLDCDLARVNAIESAFRISGNPWAGSDVATTFIKPEESRGLSAQPTKNSIVWAGLTSIFLNIFNVFCICCTIVLSLTI